jgi:hypothetical protein
MGPSGLNSSSIAVVTGDSASPDWRRFASRSKAKSDRAGLGLIQSGMYRMQRRIRTCADRIVFSVQP